MTQGQNQVGKLVLNVNMLDPALTVSDFIFSKVKELDGALTLLVGVL